MGESAADEVSPVLHAAYQHDWEAVERLRRQGAVASIGDAAACGDADAVRRYLADDPSAIEDRTPDGFTALHLAAYFGHPVVVRLLLDAGADPDVVADNPTGLRPLHAATAARTLASVRLLLDAGADPDVQQQGGFTPLMAATKHGDEDIVVLLLDRGADPSVTADDGSTAADLAGT